MCLYAKYLANMTQVSDVAPGPLVLLAMFGGIEFQKHINLFFL
jgi:hypothetical protein